MLVKRCSAWTWSAWCAATWRARAGPSTVGSGTLAGEPLPAGLLEAGRLPEVALHADHQGGRGHDQPLTRAELAKQIGAELARTLEQRASRCTPPPTGTRWRAASSWRTPSSSLACSTASYPDRRGADAGLVAILARRRLPPGRHAAVARQAARPRPAGGDQAGTSARRRRHSGMPWSVRPQNGIVRRSSGSPARRSRSQRSWDPGLGVAHLAVSGGTQRKGPPIWASPFLLAVIGDSRSTWAGALVASRRHRRTSRGSPSRPPRKR